MLNFTLQTLLDNNTNIRNKVTILGRVNMLYNVFNATFMRAAVAMERRSE